MLNNTLDTGAPGDEDLHIVGTNRSQILIKAFLLGLIIRGAIETGGGIFPVGYDPSTYYVLMCACWRWDYVLSAPLYSVFLLCLYLIIGNALIAVKIGSVFVSGLFTFSMAYWANRNNIPEEHILSFVAFTYTFFVVLRVLWDLHRNVVGISLAFLALAFYKENKKGWAFVFSFLSGLAHPLSLVFLGALVIHDLIRIGREALSVGLGVSLGVGAIVILKVVVNDFSVWRVVQSYWYVTKSQLPVYILWLFSPLIPIIVLAIHERRRLLSELLYDMTYSRLVVWVSIILMASFILKYTYRIVFLAAFPLAILTFRLAEASNWSKKALRILIIYNVIVSAFYPAVFYIHPIQESFRRTHPPALIAGNMFPDQEYAAKSLFEEALRFLDEHSVIIIHHSEISYAYAAGVPLCSNNTMITGPDDGFDRYLDLANDMRFKAAYIVWYLEAPVGSVRAPAGGEVIESLCGLALYRYSLS